MENNPKKSKALIITFVVVLLLLILGYFLFTNSDKIFGTKGVIDINKIFSPLLGTSKKTPLETINNNVNPNSSTNTTGTNTSGNGNNSCTNGTDNFPRCTTIGGRCQNGTVNPPLCNISSNGSCLNGTVNPPLCTVNGNGSCLNGTVNPPLCTTGVNGSCLNGADNSPQCTTKNGSCLNGTVNPPLCTVDNNGNTDLSNTYPTVKVTAGSSSIISGSSTTINWTSTNSTSCNAGAGNGTGKTGSFSTGRLTQSKSYSVTCTGINGSSSDTAYIYVGVGGMVGDGSGGTCSYSTSGTWPNCGTGANNFPTVTVTTNSSSITSGSSTTINWTSTNSTSCNAGVVGRTKGKSGSFSTGSLTQSKLFSVTCIGTSGSNSGSIYINVNSGVCPYGSSGTYPGCLTSNDKCPNGGIYPYCLNIPVYGTSGVIGNCPYGTSGFPTCKTCLNGADNPSLCTTINGRCLNGANNPPSCTTSIKTCAYGTSGTYPNCVTDVQTCVNLDTLDFTAEQAAEITDLLKRYYLLADKLKTDNDIISANNDKDRTNSIINQAESLTQQCIEQKSNPNYTGPKQLGSGNPYYKADSYIASIWPQNPFNPPLHSAFTSKQLDINGKGFAPLATAEDTLMERTDNFYLKKLQDDYLNWPSSTVNPDAWKNTFMNSFADWEGLNQQTQWDNGKNTEAATTTVIESLFRIW